MEKWSMWNHPLAGVSNPADKKNKQGGSYTCHLFVIRLEVMQIEA